jgi:pimeloyl-ACP methyl ester carboxylesterase
MDAGAGVAAWEQRGRYVAHDGLSVFVLDLGPADDAAPDEGLDPILVLHGFPTCSFDWRHVLPAFRQRRRVVLLDFLGFGLSDKPDRRYGIRLHADTVERVAEAVGLDRVALVTHDMGDTVGGELLARADEGSLGFDISRRVVTNGSIYIEMAHLTPGQELLLSLDDAKLDLSGAIGDQSQGFKGGVASTFAPAHQPDAEELDAQWQLVSRLEGNALLPRTIRYIEDRRAEQTRFTGAIETHASPLGVVWGELDPVAVHPMALRLQEARPDLDLVTLDGVGHYPMIEDPARFATAVLSLL